MDKERLKRRQNIRLIITESIMTLTVIVMVIVLTFVAMGYKVGTDGEVSQNGLVQIASRPSGAAVEIDGQTGMFLRTDMSRSLSSGEHTVKLSREGYDTWEKTIEIKAGLLYKLDYPRLFKNERETAEMLKFEKGLEFFTMSPDRNSILYAEENSTVFNWLKVRGEEIETVKVDIAELFRLKTGDKLTGTIREIAWNGDGDRVIVDYVDSNLHDWIVINLSRPADSINLTREFGLDFSKVSPVSSTAERLIILENSNLRIISTGSKEISRVLLSNIADFDNVGTEILYLANSAEDSTTRVIGHYNEGDKSPVTLATAGGDGVKLAISKYLDKRYLTIAVGPEVAIYLAEEITEETKIDDFTEVGKVVLSVAPEEVKVENRGRLITATNGRKIFVFDVEQSTPVNFEIESDFTGWLDGFILTNVVDNRLVIRDFDGLNKRTLGTAKAGFPAMVTGNNRYLYYVVECGSETAEMSCLMRDKL